MNKELRDAIKRWKMYRDNMEDAADIWHGFGADRDEDLELLADAYLAVLAALNIGGD